MAKRDGSDANHNTDYTWTGNTDTSWEEQGNWDSGDGTPGDDGYPSDNDDKALIDSTSNAITTSGALTIGELDLATGFTGSLSLEGNLIIDDAGSQNGNLTIDAGTGGDQRAYRGAVPDHRTVEQCFVD